MEFEKIWKKFMETVNHTWESRDVDCDISHSEFFESYDCDKVTCEEFFNFMKLNEYLKKDL